jgi:hypothetical protein
VILLTSSAGNRAAARSSPQGQTPLIDCIVVNPAATDADTAVPNEPTATFDVAVGAAAQAQSARLREFFPQLSRLEHDIYQRLLDRLAC